MSSENNKSESSKERELFDEVLKLRTLLKEALPWVDSYQRSRGTLDTYNGKGLIRMEWLKSTKSALGVGQ